MTVPRRTILSAAAGSIVAAALSSTSHAAPSTEGLVIITNAASDYTIHVGAGEDAVVNEAATTLATYFQRLTGVTLPVVRGSTMPPGPIIAIGRNNQLALALDPQIDYGALGDDGFAYRHLDGSLLITGASSRGTLYGAYWMLDHVLGVRWYMPDFTHVPQLASITIPTAMLSTDQVPRFRYRLLLNRDALDPVYRQHNMINGLRDRYWDQVPRDGLNSWSHYWPEERGQRSFHQVVTNADHWHGDQILLMSEATRQEAATRLVAIIQDRIAAGEDASSAFYQADGRAWDADDASQAFADAHGGTLAAPVVDMLNDLLVRVRATVPNARLETQAYHFTLQPPTGLTVSDGVVITFAPILADFSHSLLSVPNLSDEGASLQGWNAIADDIVVWTYLTTFSNVILPFPDWYAAAQTIKDLAGIDSVQGYLGQGAHFTKGGDLAHLHTWLLARLAWDPTLDIELTIRDFLDGCYGPAAPMIEDYLELMADAVHQSGVELHMNDRLDSAYLNFATLRDADALLAAATAAVSGDPDVTDRVARVRVGVDFVILMRRAEFAQRALELGIVWDPDTVARKQRFTAALTATQLETIDGRTSRSTVLSWVALERTPATPPAAVAGVADDDWHDYPDMFLRLGTVTATHVQDPAASDEVTISMPGATTVRGAQLPLSTFPTEGQWRIFFTVRVDAAATATAADLAFTVGVDSLTDLSRQVTIGELAGGYAEIEVPGTHSYEEGAPFAYVAPVNSALVTRVYVDRAFLVRAP